MPRILHPRWRRGQSCAASAACGAPASSAPSAPAASPHDGAGTSVVEAPPLGVTGVTGGASPTCCGAAGSAARSLLRSFQAPIASRATATATEQPPHPRPGAGDREHGRLGVIACAALAGRRDEVVPELRSIVPVRGIGVGLLDVRPWRRKRWHLQRRRGAPHDGRLDRLREHERVVADRLIVGRGRGEIAVEARDDHGDVVVPARLVGVLDEPLAAGRGSSISASPPRRSARRWRGPRARRSRASARRRGAGR
jgi:hypothetical protein